MFPKKFNCRRTIHQPAVGVVIVSNSLDLNKTINPYRFGSMALRFSIVPPPSRSYATPSWASPHTIAISLSSSSSSSSSSVVQVSVGTQEKGRGRVVVWSSSTDTSEAVVGQVTEVKKDTFWPIVKAAGDKVVVLDMYTQWCGPCKVMAPKFRELSEKYLDIVFLKLDCNEENKPLAKELGIKVVPTFKILKDSKIIKEVTGAKLEDLVVAIETFRSG